MCLLTIAGKGTDKNSEFLMKAIKTASFTNTDGGGFSFKRNSTKKVYLSKGYKTASDLIEAIKSHKLGINDELMIHQRIGNKGAKSIEMNHPFVISSDVDTILLNDKYVDYPTVCHNGTFHYYSKTGSLMSDTYWFVKELMYQKDVQNMLKTDIESFKEIFSSKLTTNRLCFLFPNENTDFIHLGEFNEDEGYLFSNNSYKDSSLRNIGGVETRNSSEYYSQLYGKWDNDDEYVDSFKLNKETDLNYKSIFGVNDEEDKNYNLFDDDEDDDSGINNIYGNKEYHNFNNRNNVIDKDYKYANASNDDIIVKGGTSFDCPETGVKFSLYMDMWIPNKFKNNNQFLAVRYNPTQFNFTDFTFTAVCTDASLRIVKNTVYEIVNFDKTMIKEGEGIHTIRRKFENGSNSKNYLLSIPAYQFGKLFISKPKNKELLVKYRGFYNLVQSLGVSKNNLRKLNRVLDPLNYRHKDNISFRGVYLDNPSSLSLYQFLSYKNLFPKSYITDLNKKDMVVFN